MKRRNFFSALVGGALGLVGMSRARREERVTDRLRRRLEENQDSLRRHIEEHRKIITCDEMPKPLSLMEIPPEVFEAQQEWKKRNGL